MSDMYAIDAPAATLGGWAKQELQPWCMFALVDCSYKGLLHRVALRQSAHQEPAGG